jgi:tetratricopeptide (TPR) repeat protein
VQSNADKLSLEFFAGLWLGGSGAVGVYEEQADTVVRSSSTSQHQSVPDRANHVLAQEEGLKLHVKRVGTLIGYLLIEGTTRCHSADSLQPIIEMARSSIPFFILDQAVLMAAAEQIGQLTASFPTREAKWMAYLYVAEASLALVCHVHGLPNPRQHKWTELALSFDFLCRCKRHESALLASVEITRQTIDKPHFWYVFTSIARTLGSPEPATRDALSHLVDAAANLFPDEVASHVNVILRYPVDAERNLVITANRVLLRRELRNDGDIELIAAILNGVVQQYPEFLPDMIRTLLDDLEASAGLLPDTRSSVVRLAMEVLNRNGNFDLAILLATQASIWLATTPQLTLMPSERAGLLNQIGICMRYAGQSKHALSLYEEALEWLGCDTNSHDVRAVLRNRAAVLRELHQYRAAIEAIVALIPHAGTSELRGLVVSQATCYFEMGAIESAQTLLEKNFTLINGFGSGAPSLIDYASLLAYLWLQAGRRDEALQLLQPLLPEEGHPGQPLLPLVWHFAGLKSDNQVAIRAAIEQLSKLFISISANSLSRLVITVITELDTAMIANGQAACAEALLRVIGDKADIERCPHSWQIDLLLAGHAQRRGASQHGEQDLRKALVRFQTGLAYATETDDILSFTSPHGKASASLTLQAINMFSHEPGARFFLAILAADIRCAPMLAFRLRNELGLLPPLIDPDAELDRLHQLLRETPAVLLQFVGTHDDVLLLRSWLSDTGELTGDVRRVGHTEDDVTATVNRLAFALARTSPSVSDLALDTVRGWKQLASNVQTCVSDLPVDLPLMIVSGPIGENALTLSLGHRQPICFAPSIAALIALRERRRAQMPPSAPSLFTFATWFNRELAASAAALAEVTVIGREIAERKGLESTHCTGCEATREALLGGLKEAGIAWLACHGHIRRGTRSVDLYVAADGHLPPADLNRINSDLRSAHLVNWQELALLEKAPQIVISSACDSGLTHITPGGERLGLERPLFCAGTRVFIAPLWPVPTRIVQQEVTILLDKMMGQTATSLVEHVFELRAESARAGVVPLAREALAVFGDGL